MTHQPDCTWNDDPEPQLPAKAPDLTHILAGTPTNEPAPPTADPDMTEAEQDHFIERLRIAHEEAAAHYDYSRRTADLHQYLNTDSPVPSQDAIEALYPRQAADLTRADHPRGHTDARYQPTPGIHSVPCTCPTQPTADRNPVQADCDTTTQNQQTNVTYQGLLSHADSEVAWIARQLTADLDAFSAIEKQHRHIAGRGNRMIHQLAAQLAFDARCRLDMLEIATDRPIDSLLRTILHALAASYAERPGHQPEWTP